MVVSVCGTFVSQKIQKVRWKPDNLCDTVVSGSWDDDDNKLTLWRCYKMENEEGFVKLKAQSCAQHYGDIMEIKFIDDRTVAVSSSVGSISLFKLCEKNGDPSLDELKVWKNVHCYSNGEVASGTDMACFEDTITSVGEDGRIVLISVKEKMPYRTIENADSCTIRCVSVHQFSQVLTGNSRGQMKVWDLRNNSNVPQTSFTLSGGGQVGFTRVISHPTQTHIKLAGGEDGTITVWDLRNNKFAVNSLNAHSQSVNELVFHPDRPEHLYSCSSNGQLWHWDSSKLNHSYIPQFGVNESKNISDNGEETGCPWMSKNLKNRITVYSVIQNLHLPVNSLDVSGNFIVCGCDNEAVYLINESHV
ncbi:nucleoporin Nup43 [Planococcus citri]|uniref:nucleoporin Nup43 n=1 Tax=Planococcus citri TaxID=170843 RepID=UPI0031F7B72C